MDYGLYTIDFQAKESLDFWEKELMEYRRDWLNQFCHQLRRKDLEIFCYKLNVFDTRIFYIDFPRDNNGKKDRKRSKTFLL